jgi:nitrogenase delta subunit
MDGMKTDARVDELVHYIMKHCLWQFHSRTWDRERQNREILGWAKKVLLGEGAEPPADRLERCHWVDGVVLARAWREVSPWVQDLDPNQTAELVDAVRGRVDFLTITGSLNKELTDHQY